MAEEQCLEPSFEGDQRWRRDDVRWQTVPNASCGDCESAVADSDQCVNRRINGVAVCVCVRPRDIIAGNDW